MSKINFLVVVIGFLTMTGCTTTSAPLLGTIEPERLDAIDYYSWISQATPAVMDSEKLRLEQQILLPGSEEALVQLAVVLGKDAADVGQETRALALLEEFDEQAMIGSVDSEYQIFGQLWQEILQMRAAVRQMSQEKALDVSRIEKLESETAELAQQIEALKQIEQQLDRRVQTRDEGVDSSLQR